jgi:hypothetical protein
MNQHKSYSSTGVKLFSNIMVLYPIILVSVNISTWNF